MLISTELDSDVLSSRRCLPVPANSQSDSYWWLRGLQRRTSHSQQNYWTAICRWAFSPSILKIYYVYIYRPQYLIMQCTCVPRRNHCCGRWFGGNIWNIRSIYRSLLYCYTNVRQTLPKYFYALTSNLKKTNNLSSNQPYKSIFCDIPITDLFCFSACLKVRLKVN